MNAKGARTLSDTSNAIYNRTQFDDVIEKIISVAKKGELELTINGFLRGDVKTRFENMGYTIKSDSHRNESSTTISW